MAVYPRVKQSGHEADHQCHLMPKNKTQHMQKEEKLCLGLEPISLISEEHCYHALSEQRNNLHSSKH
jgi:hypothetical protein